jgi:hypothetical protein
LRKAIATGVVRPLTTVSSRRCTDARFAAGSAGGRVPVVAVDLEGVVLPVVGATEVGAVDGAALGELLLHAPSASVVATIPGRSIRIEARLGRGAAYASSP